VGEIVNLNGRITPAADAQVSVFGANGLRTIPLKRFFRGMYETALEPGEILSEVFIPQLPVNGKAVYLRYNALSANDWPCLGVAAFMRKDSGRCQELRLALGGVAATPLLISGLEFAKDQMVDTGLVDRILAAVDEQISPSADLRGSEWYKRRMARLFTQKAIAQLNG
jgi:carbon-monoxide dehydrogenase medium subunit